jgi:hypothetical protein
VASRLDYSNATLAGPLDRPIHRLQSVLNAAARLMHAVARRCNRITPLLRDLHWMRVREPIGFKLAMLVFRFLDGLAPSCLEDTLRRAAGLESRRRRRSSALVVPMT